MRVSILKDDVVLGQTDEFIARPDVRDVFRKQWKGMRAERLGFIVLFPLGTNRADAILQIEAKDGRLIKVPLKEITCGIGVQISGGDFFALDEERFEKVGKTTEVS